MAEREEAREYFITLAYGAVLQWVPSVNIWMLHLLFAE